LAAAAAAVLVSYPLVNAMFDDELSVLGGLGAAVLGLMTTIAAFLGVSYLLRAPELAELRRSR
jgi:uncharacterized membrane protein